MTGVNTAGADNSYWNGGGCGAVSMAANTFGWTALAQLTPISTQLPPPLVPPLPSSCVIASPFTTQTAVPPCQSGPDTVPPTATITAPASGQVVSGSVMLSAAASDNVGVAGVQFLLNGTAMGAELTSAPYTLAWSSTAVANGSYTVTAMASDSAGNKTTSAPVTFTVYNYVVAPPAGTPVSDNFDATALNTSLWTFVNPVGNGSYLMTGANLLLTAPGGFRHDPSDGGVNDSVRVIQNISDVDFTVEAKFDSLPTLAYQMEGILVQQDAANYLRFEVSSNSSSRHLSASSIVSQVMSTRLDTVITPSGPSVWLRVQRSGTTWILLWSVDGTTFTTATTFSQPLTVTSIGPYAGNYGDVATSTPAFTASVDYFFNSAFPIFY
jgi:regulation of enolase protein 1 (concanavalin A-like superfamily)